jgi:hypothetical protein
MSAKASGASAIVAALAGNRVAAASPEADSTAGTQTASITTRSVCTIATARMSQSRPACEASAMTWARPPGVPAKIAVSRFQPCTLMR